MVPWTSKEAMILYLRLISEVTEADRHTVVIMDGAGWHTDSIADELSNVILIKFSSIHQGLIR